MREKKTCILHTKKKHLKSFTHNTSIGLKKYNCLCYSACHVSKGQGQNKRVKPFSILIGCPKKGRQIQFTYLICILKYIPTL